MSDTCPTNIGVSKCPTRVGHGYASHTVKLTCKCSVDGLNDKACLEVQHSKFVNLKRTKNYYIEIDSFYSIGNGKYLCWFGGGILINSSETKPAKLTLFIIQLSFNYRCTLMRHYQHDIKKVEILPSLW